MPTRSEVHTAIDQQCIAEFGVVPFAFGNTPINSLLENNQPFLFQTVLFDDEQQRQLGDTKSCRIFGRLRFTIYAPKDKGDGARNVLLDLITSAFRSKTIGGAIFSRCRAVGSGSTNNWSLSYYEFPFHFDNL